MARLLIFITVIAAFVAIPALSEHGVLKIVPEFNEVLLKVGATQDLNCSVTTISDPQGNTKLTWTIPTVDGKQATSGVQDWMQTFQSGNTVTMQRRLQIMNFDTVNAGEYKCSMVHNNSTTEKVILLTAVIETKTEPVYIPGNTTTTLSCSINFGTNASVTKVTWLKAEHKNDERKNEPVSKLKDSKRFEEKNNSLIITELKREDAGLYIARFEIPNQPEGYDCEVQFQAGPLVQDFEKAKNLIEGDKMELQCIVKGYPHSDVTWYKGGELLNVSSEDARHVVLYESVTEFQTVKLLVQGVEFSDAGDYTCHAHSALFNETSEKTLTVRVKDKLAALWPFLGIVGEVVVLCTIIFIYEKRRNKQVQQEEKAAEEVDGSATEKKEGLRHRGTNNPTP